MVRQTKKIQSLIAVGEAEHCEDTSSIVEDPESFWNLLGKEEKQMLHTLSKEDLFNFIKGLALVELHLEEGGRQFGSTTPVAYVYRWNIEKNPKLSREEKDEIANWLLTHRLNTYVPFGANVPLNVTTVKMHQVIQDQKTIRYQEKLDRDQEISREAKERKRKISEEHIARKKKRDAEWEEKMKEKNADN